ncbi:MAG: AraC family transcriptional regulator [Burkholderiaceae bacterium]
MKTSPDLASTTPPPATHETFEEFEQAARRRGITAVLERRWPADTVLAEHTHDFAASALLVQGRMWLTVGAATRELGPGDRFELDAGTEHAERYGSEGATYWVARR